MEIAEIIGVVFAALALIYPMIVMDHVYKIGSAALPAPQAGLMALMSRGIVGGDMAWPLVIAGIFFGIALILIKAPAPMLIAVGMYLPFYSTSAIFVGGLIKLLLDKVMEKKGLDEESKDKAGKTGILLSSGFIAGESLMAVLLAFWVMGSSTINLPNLPHLAESPLLAFLIFPVMFYLLIQIPLKGLKQK